MTLFRNFAVLRQQCGNPFAPIQILTGDTRKPYGFLYRRLHDDGRSLQRKPRIERRFESQVAGRSRLLETWSPCSRPFAILPVSAVSDAQKLATGNFLCVRAALSLLLSQQFLPLRGFKFRVIIQNAPKNMTAL